MNINNLDPSDIESCDKCTTQMDIGDAYPNDQDGFHCEDCHDELSASKVRV